MKSKITFTIAKGKSKISIDLTEEQLIKLKEKTAKEGDLKDLNKGLVFFCEDE